MTIAFEAIGTHWRIDSSQDISECNRVRGSILERIEAFDKHYSRFRADSLVTRMSKDAGSYELPADAGRMIEVYQRLYQLTGGLFTPLVGSLMEDAGYDAQYSLRPQAHFRTVLPWHEAMTYGKGELQVHKPALLDFGAGGKGYLIDLVGEVLEQYGVGQYCIDAGGDILHKGKEMLRVGLEDPQDTQKAIGIIGIQNQSICASATNRRQWGSYHHVMNPKTQSSTEGILAVWTVADTALVADSLATCLFFVAPETLGKDFTFEYLVMYSDRTIKKSPNFSAELFME